MPQADISFSVVVKEQAKDPQASAELSLSFKENAVDNYNGPIRLKIAKGTSEMVNIGHLPNLRIVAIKLVSGDYFMLSLRQLTSAKTDLQIRRFFVAEMSNVEQIKLTANDKQDAVVLIELVSIEG